MMITITRKSVFLIKPGIGLSKQLTVGIWKIKLVGINSKILSIIFTMQWLNNLTRQFFYYNKK